MKSLSKLFPIGVIAVCLSISGCSTFKRYTNFSFANILNSNPSPFAKQPVKRKTYIAVSQWSDYNTDINKRLEEVKAEQPAMEQPATVLAKAEPLVLTPSVKLKFTKDLDLTYRHKYRNLKVFQNI